MTDGVILGIVREYAKGATVSPEANFDELGIDSLEFVQIVREVEDAYKIEIPNDALPRLATIRDLIAEALRLSS